MNEGELGRAATDGALLVNGRDFVLPLPCSVAALLARLDLGAKRVAVSVNRAVIPRSRHPEALVRAGDRVEILEAVGGG
jgi:sulfur carrier protein